MNETTVPQEPVAAKPTTLVREDLIVIPKAVLAGDDLGRLGAGQRLEVADRYAGAASEPVNAVAAEALTAFFPNDAYDVLPTGEVYVSQVHYRRRLNEVLRPGGWALIPQGPIRKEGDILFREYHLLGPGGRFLAEAIGECEYQETNERMSYGDAAEGAKSNALSRCCKDLGIAAECWDRRWADGWRAKNCLQVWRSSQKKPQWRRRDVGAWWDETAIVETPTLNPTPEAPRWIGPPQAPAKATPTPAPAPPVSAAPAGQPPTPPAPAGAPTGRQEPQRPPLPYGGSEPKGNGGVSTAGLGRYGQPPCPKCGQVIPVMKSKFAKGAGTTWYCNKMSTKATGCGNQWEQELAPAGLGVSDEPGTRG